MVDFFRAAEIGDYGFKGVIDEPSVYNRALSQGEIQSIVNAGSAGKVRPVVVANANPTPKLSGAATGLATQVLTFTASATDPSTVDQAAGFAYSINWGDGSRVQTIARTAGNGSGVNLSHVFSRAGTYTVILTATDKDRGTGTVPFTVSVLDVTSANLQPVLDQRGSIAMQANDSTQAPNVVSAVNGLSAQARPGPIAPNSAVGSYSGITASPPAGVTPRIIGQSLPHKPSVPIITGASPALRVPPGQRWRQPADRRHDGLQ